MFKILSKSFCTLYKSVYNIVYVAFLYIREVLNVSRLLEVITIIKTIGRMMTRMPYPIVHNNVYVRCQCCHITMLQLPFLSEVQDCAEYFHLLLVTGL